MISSITLPQVPVLLLRIACCLVPDEVVTSASLGQVAVLLVGVHVAGWFLSFDPAFGLGNTFIPLLDALTAADCREVIVETASTRGARPRLTATLRALKPGDTLVIYKPDRSPGR